MLHHTKFFCLLAGIHILGCAVHNLSTAQSINIDYHDGRGVPDISYPAAGGGGQWNGLLSSNTTTGVARSLFNVDGSNTGATVTHTNLNFFVTPTNSVTTPPEAALLGDYAGSTGPPLHLDFAGLLPGAYDVFTYMVTRLDSPRSQTATINNDGVTQQSTSGGWSGFLAEGQTHTHHQVSVTNGTLRVTVASGGDPIINGLQLVHTVPEPTTVLLIAMAGLATMVRRSRT